MTRMTCAAALALTLLASVLQTTPSSAQQAVPPNPQVEVVYVPPRDAKFQPIYDRLRGLRVLEELTQFLAPLRLPSKLAIKIEQCGASTHSYVPGKGITICYEFIDEIEQVVPGANDRQGMIIGTFVQVMLYDVSLAVFDLLEVPVWGRESDAADRLAALLMLQFGEDVSFKTIVGVANFFIMSKRTWTGSDFADIRSPDAQRFYNYICVAYGGDPRTFSFLVAKDTGLLPKDRADRCADEYEQVRTAFYLRVMPFVDPDLMLLVRAKQWPMLGSGK